MVTAAASPPPQRGPSIPSLFNGQQMFVLSFTRRRWAKDNVDGACATHASQIKRKVAQTNCFGLPWVEGEGGSRTPIFRGQRTTTFWWGGVIDRGVCPPRESRIGGGGDKLSKVGSKQGPWGPGVARNSWYEKFLATVYQVYQRFRMEHARERALGRKFFWGPKSKDLGQGHQEILLSLIKCPKCKETGDQQRGGGPGCVFELLQLDDSTRFNTTVWIWTVWYRGLRIQKTCCTTWSS